MLDRRPGRLVRRCVPGTARWREARSRRAASADVHGRLDRSLVFGTPYLGGDAIVDPWEGSYTGGAVGISQPAVSYAHGLGEIVTAAASAGFHIDDLTEHLREQEEHRPGVLTSTTDGSWRLHVGGLDLPITYTLRAGRPLP